MLITLEDTYSSYLLAGGLAWLTQLRFTEEPSLMSPGGLTSTRVFFGESEHTNTEREKQENYSNNVHVFILKNKIDSGFGGSTGAYQTCGRIL